MGEGDDGTRNVRMPDQVRLTLRDRIVLALMACAVAAAIGVVVAWATGDTSGIVADKREVQITECGDGCRLKTCHQVTYVTDDGHRRTLCLPKGRYDRVNLGDRISG
ncbi:hypothetical protein [Micromonospora sp. NPDC003776]